MTHFTAELTFYGLLVLIYGPVLWGLGYLVFALARGVVRRMRGGR